MSARALLDSLLRLGIFCQHSQLGEGAKRWKPAILEHRTGSTRGDYWVCSICGIIEHPTNLPSGIR